MTFLLRGLLAAGCIFILAACGGGGGSAGTGGGGGSGGGGSSPPPTDSSGYTGATTPADLASSSVVPPLSGWLLLEIGLTGEPNSSIAGAPGAGIAAVKPTHSSMQMRFGKARERAVALASRMTIQAVTTEPCGVSGTAEINDDGLRDDGTGVVVFTYRDCAEGDGTTLNGVMRVTVAAADAIELTPTDYTITYENLRIAAGADTIEAGGSTHVVITGSTVTATRNTVARYLPENVYVRLQDFVGTRTAAGEVFTLSFRGRFYQSQYGYVDVQTPAIVSLEPSSDVAIAGRMSLMGAVGAARVELRFREQNALSIVVDTDGDGVAERGLSAQPSQLFQPTSNWLPMADAGWDRSVDEGTSVTLDASGNRDWEGAPLAFSWSVVTVPLNAAPLPTGTGPTYSFTPAVPGLYYVQLTVNDGSGAVATDRVIVIARDIPSPVANAGPDRTTLERSTVTLDASGTSSLSPTPESLQFAWTLISSPANSTAPTTLTGMQPQVTFDLPGTYEYRLTVTGRGGSSTDTVRIVATGVVSASTGTFVVRPETQAFETSYEMTVNVPASYAGPPLSATISSDADWLTIETPNLTVSGMTRVVVRLDLDALDSLPNGPHEGVVRIVPSGYSEWTGRFQLQLELPTVRQISPYVVYTGQATTVNLVGDRLQLANGRVVVDGQQVQGLTRASISKARAELPALAPGEYTVRVTNALGIERPGARLLVRDPPAHPDSEVTFPGRPYSIEYDPERDVFYGVFGEDFNFFARRFYRLPNGTWQFDEIAVSNPQALTIALGGERLLVTSGDCGVYEVDAVTLQTVASVLQPGCFPTTFDLIAALADGNVIFGRTSGAADLRTYPGLEFYRLLPNVAPAAMLSHDRSRMLWGGPNVPNTVQPNLWVFDVLGGPSSSTPSTRLVTSNDGTVRSIYSFAISGDGSRFMNYDDVYDNNYQYAGSLQGLGNANIASAMSRRGTRAVVYNNDTDELTLFDVSTSTGNSFPSLGLIDSFPAEVDAWPVSYFPDDRAVFMRASVQTGFTPGNPTYEYRLIVREVP